MTRSQAFAAFCDLAESTGVAHRTTTPRNASSVPPHNVKSGWCSRASIDWHVVQQLGHPGDRLLLEPSAEVLDEGRLAGCRSTFGERAGHRHQITDEAKSVGPVAHPR